MRETPNVAIVATTARKESTTNVLSRDMTTFQANWSMKTLGSPAARRMAGLGGTELTGCITYIVKGVGRTQPQTAYAFLAPGYYRLTVCLQLREARQQLHCLLFVQC